MRAAEEGSAREAGWVMDVGLARVAEERTGRERRAWRGWWRWARRQGVG